MLEGVVSRKNIFTRLKVQSTKATLTHYKCRLEWTSVQYGSNFSQQILPHLQPKSLRGNWGKDGGYQHCLPFSRYNINPFPNNKF